MSIKYNKLIPITNAYKQLQPKVNGYLPNKSIKFDNLYVSTDDINHNIIKVIFKLYPSAKLVNCDEIRTIKFGSTCKHILLSLGSFSALILLCVNLYNYQ